MRISRTVHSLLALAALGVQGLQAQEATRPNVVLILADDLGYGEVGAFGQREIQTPHLDRMAREGMKLTQFYSSSPVCAPARCALMTGMHNGRCRVPSNGPYYLQPEDVTVAEVLRYAGYANGAFGKWGLARNDWKEGQGEMREGYPTRQGFDRFFGYINQRHAHSYYSTFLISDEDTVRLPNVVPDEGEYGEGDATGEVVYSQDRILEEALQFIRQNRNGPFFAYLPLTIPHINNEGMKAPDGGFEVPDLGIYADRPWPLPKKSYAAMITRMDHDIGRVMELLRELGIDDNTFVLFTSDNGPTFLRSAHDGRTDISGDWFDGNGPFRGFKYDVYEGGIRVPTIARWPGVVPAGAESSTLGYFPDLMPTLAELAGVSSPRNIDGISLVPTLLGRPELQAGRGPVYWSFASRDEEAVRVGRWKAVWMRAGPALYDIEADPGETTDLKERHPEVMRRLSEIAARERSPEAAVAAWSPRLLSPTVRSGR